MALKGRGWTLRGEAAPLEGRGAALQGRTSPLKSETSTLQCRTLTLQSQSAPPQGRAENMEVVRAKVGFLRAKVGFDPLRVRFEPLKAGTRAVMVDSGGAIAGVVAVELGDQPDNVEDVPDKWHVRPAGQRPRAADTRPGPPRSDRAFFNSASIGLSVIGVYEFKVRRLCSLTQILIDERHSVELPWGRWRSEDFGIDSTVE